MGIAYPSNAITMIMNGKKGINSCIIFRDITISVRDNCIIFSNLMKKVLYNRRSVNSHSQFECAVDVIANCAK